MDNANTLYIPTLNAGWTDNDIVLLHACFHLLIDCIENEKLLENTDWTQTVEFIHAKAEIEQLYHWWKNRAQLETDPIWTENQYKQDNEMLIKLIKVRKFLWT